MFEGFQIRLLVYIAGFAVLAIAVWRFAVYHEDVGYQRAVNVYEARLAEAARESREKERALQQKVNDAEKRGADREAIHRTEVAVLESRLRVLRYDAAAFRDRLSRLSGAACVEAAATAAELFEQCSERYSDVAAAADGHANDVLTLTEAWPR